MTIGASILASTSIDTFESCFTETDASIFTCTAASSPSPLWPPVAHANASTKHATTKTAHATDQRVGVDIVTLSARILSLTAGYSTTFFTDRVETADRVPNGANRLGPAVFSALCDHRGHWVSPNSSKTRLGRQRDAAHCRLTRAWRPD